MIRFVVKVIFAAALFLIIVGVGHSLYHDYHGDQLWRKTDFNRIGNTMKRTFDDVYRWGRDQITSDRHDSIVPEPMLPSFEESNDSVKQDLTAGETTGQKSNADDAKKKQIREVLEKLIRLQEQLE
jgi:hypothetical protein